MTQIFVYSIAKNEAKHVERWHKSSIEADHHLILDTGSEDDTVAIARGLGIDVFIETFDPWRFDVARNVALSLLPEESAYCISLDLDEVLMPGWREAIDDAAERGLSRPSYNQVWQVNPDGTPGLSFGGDHIHTRFGYYWKGAVHEVLVNDEAGGFIETRDWIDLTIHHLPDASKSRDQYLPLLEVAVQEDPANDRNVYYLAREYVFRGLPGHAIAMFKRYLAMPGWWAERARAMVYLADLEPDYAETWLLRACGEAWNRREPWVALAKFYYLTGNWLGCFNAAVRATKIVERPMEYLNEPWAWDQTPWDLAAIAAENLGFRGEALAFGLRALEKAPHDGRLMTNVEHYMRSRV